MVHTVPTNVWIPSTEWWLHLPSGVLVSVNGVIQFANPMAAQILEVPDASVLIGQSFWNYLHPLDQHRIRSRVRVVEDKTETVPVTECRVITARGGERVLAVRSSPMQHMGQMAIIATMLDMTDRALMESRLRESDSNFNRLMRSLQDVYYRTDAQGIVVYVSAAVQRILGYAPEEVIGQSAVQFYPDANERLAVIQAIRNQGSVYEYPGRLRHHNGTLIDISITSNVLLDEDGEFAGVEGIWRDVTESKRMQQRLQELVIQDQLTGCLNRRGVMEFLSKTFQQRAVADRRRHMPFSVLVIDLDLFKSINDNYGHLVGDMVLRGVVERINAQYRPQDCFGRVGGEEFLLVLDDADIVQARDVAERIRCAVEAAPMVEGDLAIPITVSIGVAQYELDDESAMRVYERADEALYQAKTLGRNRVV
ncbi:diguanylate cyclase [Curvibacter sp. CHRR-16]|uniref:sensor domain-containing diguanylate cyclase n=1 Tax=Curvibacter sp. CHRR-16 TaxID=2835872 RepID=UPI001BDB36A5|nr:sensor domain-containing diguanylate cyclase [Curvibacter sp. CHRR-16]MBT0568817.1 diguanylate cyclase [Curvibacter sp. CHRR-16]